MTQGAAHRRLSGNLAMTVDVARRRSRRTTKVVPTPDPVPTRASESFAIGEIEQTVFSCPNCQRPLAMGAKRCPGCRTHLVGGVQLSKASALVAVGLVVGLAVGGAVGGLALLGNGLARDAEINARVAEAVAAAEANRPPAATAAPLATAHPLATTAPGGGTAIPPLARSALIQAANVNAQLAAATPVLQSALAARTFDTYTVFQVLRSVSADAVTGRPLATHIGAWSGGAELADSLEAYYTQVQDAAAEGLDASIRNEAAYRAAAKEMLTILAGLAPLDAQLHVLATDAGVTLTSPETP
jgi:hypothetical protein